MTCCCDTRTLLKKQLLQSLHLLTAFHPKRTEITLSKLSILMVAASHATVAAENLILASTTALTNKGECHHRFRPEDAPCLTLIRAVFTGGSVWTERWRQRKKTARMERGQGQECILCTQNCTKSSIRHCRTMTMQSGRSLSLRA